MWTPGHAGIQGNELADNWAKETNKKLLHASPYFTTKDIKNYVKQHITDCCLNDWSHSNHHYKLSNPSGQKPQYYNTITRKNIKTFIRITYYTWTPLEWYKQTHMTFLWLERLHNLISQIAALTYNNTEPSYLTITNHLTYSIGQMTITLTFL